MNVPALSRHNVLGVDVSAADYASTVAAVLAAAKERRPLGVSALAVHGVMCGVLDPALRYRLNRLDIVAPDGQPVRWALNILHKAGLADRTYGPELTLRVCAAAAKAGLCVYFYGSRPEVLELLTTRLGRRFPRLRIAGSRPSLFRRSTPAEQDAIREEIRKSGADIVFVGLGCPRQEVWVYENVEALSMPVLAVGAAFDFHAGVLPQAPPSLQARGLEWAFRLAHEPRRLWRRYVLLNPAYVALTALQFLGLKAFADRGHPPEKAENHA